MRDHEITIYTIERYSWEKRLAIASGVFAGIWLLLEPISAFTTGARFLSSLNWLGYLILIVLSLGATVFTEYLFRQRQIGSLALIEFFIIFIKSGRRIRVVAPHDLQVRVFLEKLEKQICDIFRFNRPHWISCAILSLYNNNLLVQGKDGIFVEVSSELTLREAGVQKGSVCRMRGYIRGEYGVTTFTKGDSGWQQVERMRRARRGGLVILDEKDSISFQEAVDRGLLDKETIARVEEFVRKGEAEIFVVGMWDEPDQMNTAKTAKTVQ